MRTLVVLLITICLVKASYCQRFRPNLSDSCSNVLSLVSYYWKLDSLANNGFRLYAYERLLNCKIDTLTVTFLLDKLGKPNKIRESNIGIDYVYYYYDSMKMPKENGSPFECGYIYFMFRKDRNYLISIGDGVLDY